MNGSNMDAFQVGPSKKTADAEKVVDIKLCIICQKSSKEATTSTEVGRKRIRSQSQRRCDTVNKRLKTLGDENENWCYHSNNECYKTYTNEKVVARIERNKKAANKSEQDFESPALTLSALKTRSQSTPGRNKPIPTVSVTELREVRCIICGKHSHNKDFKKVRISERAVADTLLKATNFFQDEVFDRTCDLEDSDAVLAADCYYHPSCRKAYERLYEKQLNESTENVSKVSARGIVWSQVVPELKQGLMEGKGYELSTIRDHLNCIGKKYGTVFNNKSVKSLLSNEMGETIRFSERRNVKNSLMVFSVDKEETSSSVLSDRIRAFDPIEACAIEFKKCLHTYDFDLNDRFCDANDLERAYTNMPIPEPIMNFFGHLYNFDPSSYSKAAKKLLNCVESHGDGKIESNYNDDEDNDEEDCEENDTEYEEKCNNQARGKPPRKELSVSRCRKIQSIFQILYYIHHKGTKRTPLHIINAEKVHSLGKGGKITLTSLNKKGLAVSYTELRRFQFDMASFTALHHHDKVSIPIHFHPGVFTLGALDNWDHEGATSEHDTVQVLFQNKPNGKMQVKPKISETSVKHGPRAFKSELQCQKLREFFKPVHHADLPENFIGEEQIEKNKVETKEANKIDRVWALSRLGVGLEDFIPSIYPAQQNIPSWSAANSVWTKENLPLKNLAFLPVLPHAVTEWKTVYSSMCNYEEIVTQLAQNHIPIFGDEKVYCMMKEIQFLRPTEFQHIVCMIGPWHAVKVLLRCCGKYIQGSGASTLWLEAEVFGPTIIENSVLNGGHYVRSLLGMQLLAECFERLILREFFGQTQKDYTNEFSQLQELQAAVTARDSSNSQKKVASLISSSLFDDIEDFIIKNSNENENFKYWSQYLSMFQTVRNMIRADREGLWDLHMESFETALGIFAVMGAINYLRWGSVYLEEMRQLETTAPEILAKFRSGNFSIKEFPGRFIAVGGDQKLEQSVNLSTKTSDNVIGNARKKTYFAQWELIYHEMAEINKLDRRYTGSRDGESDAFVHHQASQLLTNRHEEQIQKMMKIVEEKGNPVAKDSPKILHNFVTKEVMSERIRNDLLNCMSIAENMYEEFRMNRLVTKSIKLRDTIHKNNLRTMDTLHRNQGGKNEKQRIKARNISERVIEIAHSRGIKTAQLLDYDIMPSKFLFNSDGKTMVKPAKHELVLELELCLTKEEKNIRTLRLEPMESATVVDVMGNVRKIKTSSLSSFSQFAHSFCSLIQQPVLTKTYYVFDLYKDMSPKDSERIRRSNEEETLIIPIELSNIDDNTPFPKEAKRFWASTRNKVLLEKFLYIYIKKKMSDTSSIAVLGQVTEDGEFPNILLPGEHRLEHMENIFEEADIRIPRHVFDAIQVIYYFFIRPYPHRS